MSRIDRRLRALAAVANLALVGIYLAMGLPFLVIIRDQVASGYTPDYFLTPWFVAITVAPFVAALLIGLAFRPWLAGRWKAMVYADVLVTIASWSILLLYIFGSDLPLVAMALAPTALVTTTLVALRDRRRTGRPPDAAA